MPYRTSTARTLSASEAVAQMRREAADTLRAGLDACIGTRAERAASLDCSPGRLAQMLDAGDEATICVARAALLPEPARLALAGFVAGEAHAVVELPAASGDLGCDLAHATEAHRESSEAVAVALAAVADGHVSADEGARLVAEVDQAIAALLRLRALGQTAVRERVIAARRPLRAVGR